VDVANACDPASGLDPAAPWPTIGRCYARRAAASVRSVQKPIVAWTYATSIHSPAVVGRDGTIYFGKNATTGNSYLLQALRRDGTPAWSLAGGPTMSPTIGADGAIYFSTDTADYGQVVAVEPSGTVRWKANIGHTIAPVMVGADGTVYATDNNRTLTALNGTDGSVRFTRTNVSSGDWTTPAMASDGTMYMAYGDVTAMTATGTLLWQVPQQGAGSGVALGPDGTLYVPFFGDTTAGMTGGVRALDPATGATRWTVNFANDGEWLPAVAGDGTIYQPGQLALYAIDKKGKLLWVFPVGDYIGGVALGGDGTIYVSCRDENLYALNPDGSVAWTLQVGQAARPPAIGADGTLYVEGSTGLMAIGCAGGTCAACVPNCAGRRCGPDGCGSSCGACGAGDRCELATRSCQPIAPPGGAGACGDNRGLQAGAPWPALGVCPTRIGRTDQLGPRTTPSIRWSFTSGTSAPTTPSIAADGTLYFSASDRKLYAVRPDGSLRWTFAPRSGIGVAPTIGADGTIYANDGSTTASGGYVYAIRPDGSKRWSLRFPFGTPSSPMVGGDGMVYAETYAYVYGSRAVAIDPLSGTMRWATYAGGFLQAGPALGFDGSVYVHGPDLFALTPPDGRVLWHQDTTYLGLPTAVPVVDTNENVYAAQDNTLIAFAPDGTTRWTYKLTPAGTTFGTVGGAPAIGADGSVLLPISDDSALALVALDPATGAIRWQGYDGGNCSMSPAVDGGGWIYYVVTDFLSKKGILYALDGTGKLQWNLPLPTTVNRSLALGTNGILYVSGADGKLYAVGP
jgi:outer membrane protein assembly factor BamB